MPINTATILGTLTQLPQLLQTGRELYEQFQANREQFSETDQAKIEAAWREIEAERERLHEANQRLARS